MPKTALVTGISGQDGAYLARLLLYHGYRVVGAVRRSSQGNLHRLAELNIERDIELVDFDLIEDSNIIRTIDRIKPDEIYNLAAQSFVALSFEQPVYTTQIDACGVTRILEAIRTVSQSSRFYQASTSEMFGKVHEVPQIESTKFYPRSPYGIAKLYGHWITVNYRESYGLHASSGILFNHESPLRGREFVTRKITLGLAEVKHGRRDCLEIGNLDARRDWGFAADFVEGMWLMLQEQTPGDYVLATGESHSVRDFLALAGNSIGFDLEFSGRGIDEFAVDRLSGKVVARVNPKFFRPAEVDFLLGNATKAEQRLGWRRKTDFTELVAMMADADSRRVCDGKIKF